MSSIRYNILSLMQSKCNMARISQLHFKVAARFAENSQYAYQMLGGSALDGTI